MIWLSFTSMEVLRQIRILETIFEQTSSDRY